MEKNNSFAQKYPIKETYRRFDQRDSAFGRRLRKTGKIVDFGNEEERARRINKNQPGYSLVDYSFNSAAGMYETLLGEHDSQGTGFYSWKPLGVSSKPEGVKTWEGTPEKAAKIVSKAAKYFGASDVGFSNLDKRWIYTYARFGREIVFDDVEEGYLDDVKAVIPESHKWVVALTVPMEYEETMYSPTRLEVATVMGYSRMHLLAGQVAEFIRGLGYHAIPCGNDTALSVPIAIQAGLGHLGRHGRLITWDRGPLVRICKIFTDLPLSPSPQAPDGIVEFCEVCKKCAKHCPSQAIHFGPRTWEGLGEFNNSGVYKWYCDAEKCLDYWHQIGNGCNNCFRVCSFTKPEGFLHNTVKWFIRNIPILNRFWVWADDIMGYGKMKDPRKYWG